MRGRDNRKSPALHDGIALQAVAADAAGQEDGMQGGKTWRRPQGTAIAGSEASRVTLSSMDDGDVRENTAARTSKETRSTEGDRAHAAHACGIIARAGRSARAHRLRRRDCVAPRKTPADAPRARPAHLGQPPRRSMAGPAAPPMIPRDAGKARISVMQRRTLEAACRCSLSPRETERPDASPQLALL